MHGSETLSKNFLVTFFGDVMSLYQLKRIVKRITKRLCCCKNKSLVLIQNSNLLEVCNFLHCKIIYWKTFV
jgi:hypothetical protein